MTLPALANLEQLRARIPGGIIPGADETRAQAALDDASAIVREAAGKTWVTGAALDADIPDVIVTVTCAAARRSVNNPDGVRSESTASYSVTLADSSGDVFLTAAERRNVASAAGKSGLGVMPTTRVEKGSSELTSALCDVSYRDDRDAQPIPWNEPPR